VSNKTARLMVAAKSLTTRHPVLSFETTIEIGEEVAVVVLLVTLELFLETEDAVFSECVRYPDFFARSPVGDEDVEVAEEAEGATLGRGGADEVLCSGGCESRVEMCRFSGCEDDDEDCECD